ncbi:unnamed protein product [Candidula unifasciata]|uniref:Uncharacterized protein n=1 Tax=Candidula unifasciata TaxID=100452 RepID=A0A8S3ZY85_9EUPU|nr:unnamed protein product [Candidula unifasciata]
MATGLFENAMQQCDKYWVESTQQHVQHGQIHIWHQWSTTLAQLKIRTFRIQKEGFTESRLVTQYEMIGFHDESPDPGLLLDVRRRVIATSATQPGPILVHCRCGGGRTAVFIAVDFCLHQLQSEDKVDVYSIVLHLRRFRKNMVRTLSQYKQIYKTVAMFLQCGLTVYPADTLPAAFQVHYAQGSDSKHQKLEKEFQTLQSIVPRLSIGDCASGHRVENRSKSRDIMMLPPECARPYLATADCGDSGTDFINAVYVDGYHAENTYLVTQWPMRKTIVDLWRLMYDFKITSLAFLNDPQKSSRTYPRFWPKEVEQEPVSYGPISVRYLKCEKHANIMTRTFAIRKVMNGLIGCDLSKDELIVKMFQIMNSGQRNADNNHSDHSSNHGAHHGHNYSTNSAKCGKIGYYRAVGIQPRSLLALMDQVTHWQECSKSRHPICVMSKDGCNRVGLYCAIGICCDQVKEEREVDVFNAVRLVRKNRPQLVPNIEEYRYIYYFMTEFIPLCASKPDVIISEPSHDVSHHCSNPHNATASTVLPATVHGGVYVAAKDTNRNSQTLYNKSRNSFYTGHEQATSFKMSSPCNSRFVCSDQVRMEDNSVKPSCRPCSSRTSVPCSLSYESGLYETYTNSRDQKVCSQQTVCSCCSNISQISHNPNPGSCHLYINCENKQPLNSMITSATNGLTYSQVLSHSKLKPSNEIRLTLNNSSIIRYLPQVQSDQLSYLSLSPSSAINIKSSLSEPASTALSTTPFHTPEKYSNGRINNGLCTSVTSASLSPGSICKSSSFHSCSSQLSLSNNYLANGSVSKHADKGDMLPLDVINRVVLYPGLVSGNTSKITSLPQQVDHTKKRASSTGLYPSSSLPPDLRKLKTKKTNKDSNHVTLIHASYASLEDSLAGSTDARDHPSMDRLEYDEDTVQRYSHAKSAVPQTSNHAAVSSNWQPLQNNRVIRDKTSETSICVNKFPASTLSFRQKIKGYMNRKQMKITEPKPSSAARCSDHFESRL